MRSGCSFSHSDFPAFSAPVLSGAASCLSIRLSDVFPVRIISFVFHRSLPHAHALTGRSLSRHPQYWHVIHDCHVLRDLFPQSAGGYPHFSVHESSLLPASVPAFLLRVLLLPSEPGYLRHRPPQHLRDIQQDICKLFSCHCPGLRYIISVSKRFFIYSTEQHGRSP